MKMRTVCLAALWVLAMPLLFCMGSPPQGTKTLTSVAAGTASHKAALGAASAKGGTSVGAARFPHEKHATELGIECTQCHHETNAGPLSTPHKSYFDESWIDCGICHRKAGAPKLEPQACSACHHDGKGDVGDETLSAKVVIHKNCWSCHEVGTGVAASTACKGCHTPGS